MTLRSQFVVRKMASQCSLSALFPIQSQLDNALDDATTQREKETLVYQYLKKLDEREDLKIPDFEPGQTHLQQQQANLAWPDLRQPLNAALATRDEQQANS